MKIVIDTNVVASAMFFGGKPRRLLEMLIAHDLDAYASLEIIAEYKETAEELQARYPGKSVQLPLGMIIGAMKLISPVSGIRACRDPDDDKFIECALDAKCLYVVSGDKDLLTVRQYQNVQIVTVAEFLMKYKPDV